MLTLGLSMNTTPQVECNVAEACMDIAEYVMNSADMDMRLVRLHPFSRNNGDPVIEPPKNDPYRRVAGDLIFVANRILQ